MITALHAKRNRPYLHTLVFVLLVSWIVLTISATCTMPMPSALTVMPEHMPGCPQSETSEHSHQLGHVAKTMQGCAFKPCLDQQDNTPVDFSRLVKPDLPVVILSLAFTFFCFFLNYPLTTVPYKTDPPTTGRRILLIYWFCTLLN